MAAHQCCIYLYSAAKIGLRQRGWDSSAVHLHLILGCVLLCEYRGELLSGGSNHGRFAVVIFADTLLFSAIFLTGTVIESVGFLLGTPEGALLSTNNYVAMSNVAATILGRGLGPPTARAILSISWGQTAYSWQQFVASSVAVVLMELTMTDYLHLLDKDFANEFLSSSGDVHILSDGKTRDTIDEMTAPIVAKS